MRLNSIVTSICAVCVSATALCDQVTEDSKYYPIIKKYVTEAAGPAPREEIAEGDSEEECVRKLIISESREAVDGEEGVKFTLGSLAKAMEMHPDSVMLKIMEGRALLYSGTGRIIANGKPVGTGNPYSVFLATMLPLLLEKETIPRVNYQLYLMFELLVTRLKGAGAQGEGDAQPVLVNENEFVGLFCASDDTRMESLELLRNYCLSKVSPSYFLPLHPERVKEIEEAKALMKADGNKERAIRLWDRAVLESYKLYLKAAPLDELAVVSTDIPKDVTAFLNSLENPEVKIDYAKCLEVSSFAGANRNYFKDKQSIPNYFEISSLRGVRAAGILNAWFMLPLQREKAIEMAESMEDSNDDIRLLMIKYVNMSAMKEPDKTRLLKRILYVLQYSDDIDEMGRKTVRKMCERWLAKFQGDEPEATGHEPQENGAAPAAGNLPDEVLGFLSSLEEPEQKFGIQECHRAASAFVQYAKYLKGYENIPNIDRLKEVHDARDIEILNMYYKFCFPMLRRELLEKLNSMIRSRESNDDIRLLALRAHFAASLHERELILKRLLELVQASNDMSEEDKAQVKSDYGKQLENVQRQIAEKPEEADRRDDPNNVWLRGVPAGMQNGKDAPFPKETRQFLDRLAEGAYRNPDTGKTDFIYIITFLPEYFKRYRPQFEELYKDVPNMEELGDIYDAREVEVINLCYKLAISTGELHPEYRRDVLERLESMDGVDDDARLLYMKYICLKDEPGKGAERLRLLERMRELTNDDNNESRFIRTRIRAMRKAETEGGE